MENNAFALHYVSDRAVNNVLTLKEIVKANEQIDKEISKCDLILESYRDPYDPEEIYELEDHEIRNILEVAQHYKECLETMKNFKYKMTI